MVDLTSAPQVSTEGLPGRPYPRLADGVSPQDVVAGLGRAVDDVGSVMQGVTDRVMAQARQTQLTDAHNQLQTLSLGLTHDPQTGAFTKQGKDAFGITPQYQSQYDAQAQKIVDAVPDPRARQAAQQASAQIRNQMTEQLETHELSQHQSFGIQTANDSVKLAQQAMVANYNHADIIATNKDSIDASIENLGKLQGWSPEQIAENKSTSHQAAYTGIINRQLADGKVDMADAFYNHVKDELTGEQAYSAQQRIETAQKNIINEQKQGIADRYEDSLKGAQFGLSNPIQVTRQEMDVLYPKDAQRHWDELQIMAKAGAASKNYDSMPADAVMADVERRKPNEGSPEALYQIEGYQIAARAAEQSLKSRQADPAGFLVDNKRWHPLNLSNPQQMMANLQNRANTQGEVSAQLGIDAPLLSKQETQQFTSALDKATPAERLGMLGQLRQGLGSDRAYTSLLSQVAPHSPLTALAGTTLDRPSFIDTPTWFNPNFADRGETGQRILEGQEILRAKDEKGIKSGFPMPKEDDLQNQFLSAMGGSDSDLFRGRPDTQSTYYAAYKAAYAAEASKAGVTNGVLNSDLAEKAAHDVLGGDPVQYGHTYVVPPAGMDPTKFEGTVDKASRLSLTDAGYSEKDIDALRGYGLRELGDTLGTGRYVIINGNGDPLKSKDGSKTVIIDLNSQFKNTTRGMIERSGN